MTLNNFIKKLLDIVKLDPKFGNFPLMSSGDDEGNCYNKVIFEPNLAQVQNTKDHNLELVGFYDKKSKDISIKDVNIICIN